MRQKISQQHRPAATLPAQITVAAPDGDPERSPMPAAQDQLTAERGGGNGLGILTMVERIQGREALQAGQNASTEACRRCGFRGGNRIRCRQNGEAFGQAGRIAAGGQPPAPLAAAARRQQGEGAIKTHGNAATAGSMPAPSRRPPAKSQKVRAAWSGWVRPHAHGSASRFSDPPGRGAGSASVAARSGAHDAGDRRSRVPVPPRPPADAADPRRRRRGCAPRC